MEATGTDLLETYLFVPSPVTHYLCQWKFLMSNSDMNFSVIGHLPGVRLPLIPTVTVTLAFLLFILVLVHHYYKTHLTRRSRLLNKLPGSKLSLPFIGQSYLHLGPAWKSQMVFTNYVKQYGKVCRFWHFGVPLVLICDAKVCEKILGSPDLFEKSSNYENLRDIAAAGLVTSTGERWKRDRKALHYAFNRQLFDGFIKIFDNESKTLLKNLHAKFEKSSKPQNLYLDFLTAALDMVYQAAIGVKVHAQEKGQNNILSKAINTLLTATHVRIFKPHIYKTPLVYRVLGKLQAETEATATLFEACAEPMNRKIKELQEAEINGNDENKTQKTKPFLDILMEQTPQPTRNEYCEHLITIIGAGAETTASSVYQTLFFLALHPQHQKQVQEEVDAIMGPDCSSSKELTLTDLNDAKYLEMCWKESMRLRPPVPILARRLTRDVKLEDGTILPKDTDAVILIHDLHRDSEVFPDPEKFDPIRFSPENSSKRSLYSYVPFSAGNRNCIGLRYAQLEAKITLIHVLSRFNVRTKQKQEDIKVILGVPGIPYPAIELLLEPRLPN